MGKVRRYKKKLAKASSGTNNDGENKEESQYTDYLELAEELLTLKKDDDKMSVCSVMKSVKSSGGGESLKLKKDAKRVLRHAFLLKRLEKTQKSIKKKKKRSNKDDDSDDDDNVNEAEMSNKKVIDWPVENTKSKDETRGTSAKKHRKGFQKKQNALLAKDLVLFSKKIQKQMKNPIKMSTIITWFLDNNKEDQKIIAEVSVLKEEQSEISMVKEFAKHAKLQRKIIKLNEQLKNNIRANAAKNIKTKLICRVFLFFISVIVNFLFVYYNYRQNVLNEIPAHLFSPFSWLVSWPSSQDGAMSFLFWYSITNCVAKVSTSNIL